MTQDSARQELVKEIDNNLRYLRDVPTDHLGSYFPVSINELAIHISKYILERDKKIVARIIKHKDGCCDGGCKVWSDINETLKIAGITA